MVEWTSIQNELSHLRSECHVTETKVHLEGALRNGHSNITVSFLNTPPLRHVPMVKIIRSVQRSEVPDEGPPGAAAQASRM